MINSRQTFDSVEQASTTGNSVQNNPVPDTGQTFFTSAGTACPDGSYRDMFTVGAALHRISHGIRGGEAPLQFSNAIDMAQQQCGNRATLQFAAQQMRLHDRDSAAVHAVAKTGFQGSGAATHGAPARNNDPVQMMLPRSGALRSLMSSGRGRYASGGNNIPPRVPRVTRQEAMARRRDVSIPEMNELYARLNSSHFGYAENRKRVVDSGFLKGVSEVSPGEDVARRFKTIVLAGDSEYSEDIDRVMAQGFTSGGVEPLTTALMDPEISRGLNKQPLSKESFLEFVSDSRKYLQNDECSIGILVNRSGTPGGWEVGGVITQYLEGYIAQDPGDQEEFSKLNDSDRTRWIREGRAMPRAMDFGEKVLGKYPWAEHLGGTLDMFGTKELLYGPDPITHQDNLLYAFMAGVDPLFQGAGLGMLLFQALDTQNYAKGIDATMAEFTSRSRALGRTFGWKKHKEILYKDYLVWRYLAADGRYDIPPDGGRYTREEMASKGLTGEHRHAPWAGIDWEGAPHNQTTDKTRYKPDPRYSSGWHSGPGGVKHAIPTDIRGGVAAYKTYPLPELTPYDERILTPAARKKSRFPS